MDSSPRIFHRTTTDNSPDWVFIIPSLILIALIGLPILALVWRSANIRIFAFAFTESAFKALKLSLITSSISVLLALLTGTPLVYIQAHWHIVVRRS